MADDVTIDRTGDVPKRTDNRSVLHQLRDALNAHLPATATDRNVSDNGQKKSLMQAVDDAVTGAPAPGSQEY